MLLPFEMFWKYYIRNFKLQNSILLHLWEEVLISPSFLCLFVVSCDALCSVVKTAGNSNMILYDHFKIKPVGIKTDTFKVFNFL